MWKFDKLFFWQAMSICLFLFIFFGAFVPIFDRKIQKKEEKAKNVEIVEPTRREVVLVSDCSRIKEAQTFEIVFPDSSVTYENHLVLEDGRQVIRSWDFVEQKGGLWCQHSVVPTDSVKIP